MNSNTNSYSNTPIMNSNTNSYSNTPIVPLSTIIANQSYADGWICPEYDIL
jgi:hypothetical protein